MLSSMAFPGSSKTAVTFKTGRADRFLLLFPDNPDPDELPGLTGCFPPDFLRHNTDSDDRSVIKSVSASAVKALTTTGAAASAIFTVPDAILKRRTGQKIRIFPGIWTQNWDWDELVLS